MYSQNKEDEIILEYFNGHIGTLVEIGANNGRDLSNSLAFIEKGWGAYLFEPSTACADLFLLHKDNPMVHVYNFGLAKEDGVMDFFESGAHVPNGKDHALVSTAVASEMGRWNDVKFTKRKADFVNFNNWWNANDCPTLDFISLDVEGMELDILHTIDLTAVKCEVLCVEWNSNQIRLEEFKRYCAKHGMHLIHTNQENAIFTI